MFKPSPFARKKFVLASFVATVLTASLAFAQFKNPIQIPPGKIPAAPAGGLDPSKLPDIEDIHLGMTPDAVLAKMKTLYAGPALKSLSIHYTHAPNPPWVATLTGTTPFCNSQCNNDQLTAIFSAPPSKQVLVSLTRDITFQFGKQPTEDSIKSALLQKYGANPMAFTPDILQWTFNEQGGPPATAPVKQMGCGATIAAPQSNVPGYTGDGIPLMQQDVTQWLGVRCNNLGVYVAANIGAAGGVVNELIVKITDTAEDLRDALAGEAYIEGVNAAAEKNLQQNTKQNVPSL